MADKPDEILLVDPNRMLAKLVQDVYFGNGKPALTVRIAGIEEQHLMFEKTLDRVEKVQAAAFKLVIGTLITSVGGLILMVISLLRTSH